MWSLQLSGLTPVDPAVVVANTGENALNDGPVADLVDGLNSVVGAGTLDYIPTGPIGTEPQDGTGERHHGPPTADEPVTVEFTTGPVEDTVVFTTIMYGPIWGSGMA